MPASIDRRAFAAIAFGLASQSAARAKDPPAKKAELAGLPILTGDPEPPLPVGVVRRLGRPTMRLPGSIQGIRYAPTGSTLIAATSAEIRFVDPADGRIKGRYKMDSDISAGRLTTNDVLAVEVSRSNGRAELRGYAFGTGKQVFRSVPGRFDDRDKSCFSPDGLRFAYARRDKLICIEAATGTVVWEAEVPKGGVSDLQFSNDGVVIYQGGREGVRVFEAASGKARPLLPLDVPVVETKKDDVFFDQRSQAVTNIVSSPEGRWLAACVSNDSLVIWDLKAGKMAHRLKESPTLLGFTPNGQELIGYDKGLLSAWSPVTGKSFRSVQVPSARGYQLSPDGRTVAVDLDDAIALFDTVTGAPRPHTPDPPGLPVELHFRDATHLRGRLGEWGGWIEWDLRTGKHTLLRPPGLAGHEPIDLAADGRTALYNPNRDKPAVHLRDVATGKMVGQIDDAVPDALRGRGIITMSPDARQAAFPRGSGITLQDLKDGTKRDLGTDDEDSGIEFGPVFAMNGQRVLAAVPNSASHRESRLLVFDTRTGRILAAKSIPYGTDRLAVSPDGAWAVASGEKNDGRGDNRPSLLVAIDAVRGRFPIEIARTQRSGAQLAIANGGRAVAIAEQSERPQIIIMDVPARSVRLTLSCSETPRSLAFSPDGRYLAAAVSGRPVLIYDLFDPKLPGSPSASLDAAWSDLGGDGARVYAGLRYFVARPREAAEFLRKQISPVLPPDPEAINRLLDDLDHREFRKREAASRRLADLGERARGALYDRLLSTPSAEVRDRIEKLLGVEGAVSPTTLRQLRAIDALEATASAEAEALLQHWTTGAAGAEFTEAARQAVERMKAARGK